MKIRIKPRKIMLFLSGFLVVISNSAYINHLGIQTIFEYTGYGLFLAIMYKQLAYEKNDREKKVDILLFFIVLFLFCIGIALQQLETSRKITLFLSMFILESFMIFGGRVIKSANDLITLVNSIYGAGLVCFLLSMFTGSSIIMYNDGYGDGLTGITFGFLHKNYSAATFISAMVIIYVYRRWTMQEKKYRGFLFIAFMIVVLSASRGSWILLLLFFSVANLYKIAGMSQRQRLLFNMLIIFLAAFLGYILFELWALQSTNFLFRFRGLTNYLSQYHNDVFHMFFGNAEMAYREGGDFRTNFRSVVGWDSSTEMAFLNILVKNGLFGLIGYIMIFLHIFKKKKKSRDVKKDYLFASIYITLITSVFVESYFVNLQFIISPIFFVCLWIMVNISRKEDVLVNRNC